MAEKIGLEAVLELGGFRSAVSQYNSAISGMSKNTASVASSISSSFAGLGNSILSIGAIAGGAALAGVTALGAGLATFAVSGIKQAIDLDQQVANIAATMGATRETAGTLKEELKGLALDLSLNPNLTVDVTQAGQAIEVLAANGALATDEFGKLTQASKDLAIQTVALANATGSDFTTAATIATDAMALFGLKTEEMGKAVDGAAGIMNASKFDAQDYQLALSNAGGIAAEMGLSIEDFNTVIAGTASNFASGSDAGTSFKTLLQRLANPTDEVKAAMQQYGISLFDAEGNMRDMADVAQDLNQIFNGTVTVTSQVGGATKEQAKAAEQASEKISDLTRDIGQQEAKLKLMNDVYQESLKFYDAGEPKMRAQALAIEKLSSNITDQKEKLGGYQQAISLVDGAQARTVTSTQQLTEAQKAQLAATLGGSDGARILLGLADLTAEEFDALSESVNRTGQGMEAAALRVDTVKGAMDIFKGVLQAVMIQVGDQFLPLLKDMAVWFTQFATEHGPAVVAFFGKISTAIGKVIGAFQRFGVRGATVSILGQLGLDQSQISEIMGIVDQVVGAINRIKGAFDEFGIGGATFSILEMLGMSPETIALIDTNLTSVIDSITTFVNNVMVAFERFGVKGAAFSILGQLGISSDTLIELETTLTEIVTGVTGFVTRIQEAFMGGSEEGGLSGGITASLQTMAGEILEAIPEMLTELTTGIATLLTEQWPTIQASLSEWGDKFWDWTETAAEGGLAALGAILLALAAWVTDPAAQQGMADIGSSWGQSITNGILNSARNVPQFLKIIAEIAGGLAAAALAGVGLFIVAGSQIVAGIWSGILKSLGVDLQPALFSELGTILSNIGNDIATIAKVLGERLVKAVNDGLISALKSGMKFGDEIKKKITEAKAAIDINEWMQLGGDLMEGLLEGIKENSAAVLEFLKNLAWDSLASLQGIWQSSSPSKAFYKIGQSAPQGVIGGVQSLQGQVKDAFSGLGQISSKAFVDAMDVGAQMHALGASNVNDLKDIFKLNSQAVMDILGSGGGEGELSALLGQQAAIWNVPPQFAQDLAQANGLFGQLIDQYGEFARATRLENLGRLTQMAASFSGLGGTFAGILEEQMAGADAAKKAVEEYQSAVKKLTVTEGENQIAIDKKNLAIEKASEALGFGERQMDIYRQELATLMLDEEGNALQIEKKILQMDKLTESMDAQSKTMLTLQDELNKLTGDMEKNQAAVAKAEKSYKELQAQAFDLFSGNQTDAQQVQSEIATIALLEDFLKSGAASFLIPADAVSQAAGITGILYDQISGQQELNRLLAEQARREELITAQKEAQQKLDFLKSQLDLINLGRQLGGNIFQGITFGLDASVEDLLAATNAVTQAMVNQINEDLQIASPSKVMIKTFKQVMAGAAIGMERGQSMLTNTMRNIPLLNGSMPVFSQQGGATSNNQNTYNYNMPMTVNTAASASGVIRQYEIKRSMYAN